MTRREAVHEMIDYLPDDAIEEVEALLERYRCERIAKMLAEAPEEDEELSAEEIAGMERGLADIRAGRVVGHADVLRSMAALLDAPR